MINDSDEEVLYGSDTEELISIQTDHQSSMINNNINDIDINNSSNNNNNTCVANLIDTRTDEESD